MSLDINHLCLEQESAEVVEGQGRNMIPQPEREPLWKGYLKKFKDPLIVVLLVVFCFSVGVALYEILRADKPWFNIIEPAGVFIALMLATGIGFIFEVRAEREFRVLNQKKDERPVKVLRWAAGANRNSDRPQMYQVKKCEEGYDIVQLI